MGRAWGLTAALCAALLCGCVAAGPADRLGAPPPSPTPDVPGRALEAYGAAGDGESLRRALDQVELALAVAPPGHGLRPELLAAEGDLVARLDSLDAGPAAGAIPGPETAAPDAGEAAVAPAVSSPAATAAPPTAPPSAVAAPARRQAPAAPAPSYAVATRKSFEGSGNSGQFASCIDVQILGRGGPVAGAVIGINNGDLSYQDQTDQSGYSGRCGLGASNWSVVIFWTPAGGQAHGSATTVYVSGAPEQRAAVVFQGR